MRRGEIFSIFLYLFFSINIIEEITQRNVSEKFKKKKLKISNDFLNDFSSLFFHFAIEINLIYIFFLLLVGNRSHW